GPAHQACEYGVPVVSADLKEFRDMAADENMAISFYKTGDPADLADQLIALLESSEEQRRAAEQNYYAAIRMTMPHIVRHYLRWFQLADRKRTLGSSGPTLFPRRRAFRRMLYGLPPDPTSIRTRSDALSQNKTGKDLRPRLANE